VSVDATVLAMDAGDEAVAPCWSAVLSKIPDVQADPEYDFPEAVT